MPQATPDHFLKLWRISGAAVDKLMSYQVHIASTAEHDIMQAADYIEFTLKNPDAAENLLTCKLGHSFCVINQKETAEAVPFVILHDSIFLLSRIFRNYNDPCCPINTFSSFSISNLYTIFINLLEMFLYS